MMTLKRPDASVVPFGTTVSLVSEENKKAPETGIVGEMGATYLSGLPEKGQLIAQWGKDATQQCHVNYQLTAQALKETLPTISANCI